MQTALLGLAVLACPVGMGVMMLMMGRSMRGGGGQQQQAPTTGATDLADLRDEHARLGEQIEALEESRPTTAPAAR